MELQDLVSRVRKTIGEVEPNGYNTQPDGSGSWDNWQIIGYLNEAMNELAHIWRKEKIGSIAVTTQGQTDFPLPLDSLEDGIRAVLYVSNGSPYPVRYVDLDRYNRLSTGLLPYSSMGRVFEYVYTVFGGAIKIYPGAASTSDTLQPYYYRTPVVLVNAADVPEIPARFHQALVFYGVRECQNAVEEVNLESDANQKWLAELQRFRVEMSRNQRDKGIRMRGRR